jgi:general secretion pathway protein C
MPSRHSVFSGLETGPRTRQLEDRIKLQCAVQQGLQFERPGSRQLPLASTALNHNPSMSIRWWTFGVWAAVAASAWYWGVMPLQDVLPIPHHAQSAEIRSAVAPGDLTRLLGADAPPTSPAEVEAPQADRRFQLVGVVSPRSTQAAREGLALIAVDGRPPKAIRVGAVVDGPFVLQAVSARSVRLGPREGATAVGFSLTLPGPADAAATGAQPTPGTTQKLVTAVPVSGGGPQILAGVAAEKAPSRQSRSLAERPVRLTEEQQFQQRQEKQFQEEQMQNQAPDPANLPTLPNGAPLAASRKLR